MGSMSVLLGHAWCPWESKGVHGMCTTHHLPCMLRAHGQQVGGPGTYLVPMGVHGMCTTQDLPCMVGSHGWTTVVHGRHLAPISASAAGCQVGGGPFAECAVLGLCQDCGVAGVCRAGQARPNRSIAQGERRAAAADATDKGRLYLCSSVGSRAGSYPVAIAWAAA